jgi:hypothetical protein
LTNSQTLPPVAFTAAPGATSGSITLTWANNVANVNNVAGLMLAVQGGPSPTFKPTTTGATVTGLAPGAQYTFTLQAVSGNPAFNSALNGPISANAAP